MQAHFTIAGAAYRADLTRPIDISLPLRFNEQGVNAWYAPWPEAAPVEAGNFVGSVARGGSVNFFNVRLNPHGNGTHTECVGHITPEQHSVRRALTRFLFTARLVSLYPVRQADGDRVITAAQLAEVLQPGEVEAVVLRTLPNDDHKRHVNYSGANAPYLEAAAAALLADYGIEHLLLDLPSVDREEDGGRLAAHRAFWRYPEATRQEATITELIYVPNAVADGLYLLQLQLPAFELDAAPAWPVLYKGQVDE